MHFRQLFHHSKLNDLNKITAVLSATTEIHPIDTVTVFSLSDTNRVSAVNHSYIKTNKTQDSLRSSNLCVVERYDVGSLSLSWRIHVEAVLSGAVSENGRPRGRAPVWPPSFCQFKTAVPQLLLSPRVSCICNTKLTGSTAKMEFSS